MDWNGEERRMNCQAHEQNTKDLASLKSSSGTMKWLIQFAFPVVMVLLTALATLAYNGLRDTLKEIQTDLKEVKATVATTAISQAVTRTEVEQLKKEVEFLNLRLSSLEKR